MDHQKAVFINTIDCSKNDKLSDVLKEMLDVGCLPPSSSSNDEFESYPWNVDTKYYTATVNVSILKKKSIINEEFAGSVEAVLLYFDSSKESNGLKTLQSWMSFVDMWQPGIRLAVCERCDSDTTISRVTIQEWCLDHEFELIELNPDPEDYDEYEDVGVKRICNALKAHMWPNMVMKDPQTALKKVQPATCGVAAVKARISAPPESAQSRINGLLGGGEFDDILGDENEEDSFEKLFCKMKVMKDKADALPEEERKKYAENMVKAFWFALGGDDDEFEGVSSDDEKVAEDASKT